MLKRISPLILGGAILVIAVAVLTLGRHGYLGELAGRVSETGPPVAVRDLDNIATLREAFNRDAGSPRLILLVSPT
jgi:hypothetical protein